MPDMPDGRDLRAQLGVPSNGQLVVGFDFPLGQEAIETPAT